MREPTHLKRCAELLQAGISLDIDGDVSAIHPEALEAIELARVLRFDLASLLNHFRWLYRPDLLFRLACRDEAQIARELRLQAILAARSVRDLCPEGVRALNRESLLLAASFAKGKATYSQLERGELFARDRAYDADRLNSRSAGAAEAAMAVADALRADSRNAAVQAIQCARTARILSFYGSSHAWQSAYLDSCERYGNEQNLLLIRRAVALLEQGAS